MEVGESDWGHLDSPLPLPMEGNGQAAIGVTWTVPASSRAQDPPHYPLHLLQ